MSDYGRTVILGSARTPIGKLGGALTPLDTPSLGAIAMADALERAGVAAEHVDYVVMETLLQAGQGMISVRQALAKAGLPVNDELGHDQHGLRMFSSSTSRGLTLRAAWLLAHRRQAGELSHINAFLADVP